MESTSVARLFISLNPPPELVSKLRDQQTFLRERLHEHYGLELSVRWTKPTQYHLTLVFLGNLFWHQVEWIREQITETVALAETLPTLEVSGFGCFPVVHSPRVLWVGVRPNEQLQALQSNLLERFSPRLSLDNRDRSYPHITLGRVKRSPRSPDFSEALNQVAGIGKDIIATWKTTSLSLMESLPGPHGVEYSCLAEFFTQNRDDGSS